MSPGGIVGATARVGIATAAYGTGAKIEGAAAAQANRADRT